MSKVYSKSATHLGTIFDGNSNWNTSGNYYESNQTMNSWGNYGAPSSGNTAKQGRYMRTDSSFDGYRTGVIHWQYMGEELKYCDIEEITLKFTFGPGIGVADPSTKKLNLWTSKIDGQQTPSGSLKSAYLGTNLGEYSFSYVWSSTNPSYLTVTFNSSKNATAFTALKNSFYNGIGTICVYSTQSGYTNNANSNGQTGDIGHHYCTIINCDITVTYRRPCVRIWRDGDWFEYFPQVWNGSRWIRTSPHVWDGTKWVLCKYEPYG